MFRFFALFALCFAALYSNVVTANECDPKHYVYNHEGKALFVKVYIETPKAKTSIDAFDLQKKTNIWSIFLQTDDRGSFIVVPIKTNRDKGDEDYWECPICGTENPASRNTCSNPKCPLYRKKGRDW
jgi:hypothetical protein